VENVSQFRGEDRGCIAKTVVVLHFLDFQMHFSRIKAVALVRDVLDRSASPTSPQH